MNQGDVVWTVSTLELKKSNSGCRDCRGEAWE